VERRPSVGSWPSRWTCFVELDSIFHQPGWTELCRDDFRERVGEALTAPGLRADISLMAGLDVLPSPPVRPAPAILDCERWFVHRGVPHFIEHYDASEHIWTRSLPLLVVIYVLRGLYALDLDKSFVFNLVALLLTLVVLVATWAIANLLRHRPAFAWPREVGPWELVVFIVGPAIPSVLYGQWADAFKATVLALVTLGIVYMATSYGLLPMLRWASERSVALADSMGSVLRRALPLLLVSITFLFLAAEAWEVLGQLHGIAYLLVLGLFVGIGAAFVLSHLPGDIAAAGTLDSWGDVRSLVAGTPARAIDLPAAGQPSPIALSGRERANVALVGLFARTVQIAAVAAGVWLFLVAFGTLAMSERSTASWVGDDVNVLLSWSLDQRDMVVTEELLRVAGFLATFTGLSFTVYLVTDPTYREEFRTDVASELREAFAVRVAYRWALAEGSSIVAPDPSG
jgi:hypothetical protein